MAGGLAKQKKEESSQIKTFLYLVKMYLVSKNRGREGESAKILFFEVSKSFLQYSFFLSSFSTFTIIFCDWDKYIL